MVKFMTKQEFLDLLRQALNGKVAPAQLAENMRFYEDYINTEIRKGKSEEEVLGELGDPRLIARTIVETNAGRGGQSAQYSGGWHETQEGPEYDEYDGYGQRERMPGKMLLRLPLWVWLVLLILIIVLVVGAIFSVLAAILPVILPILLVLLLVKAFRDWLN